MDTRQTPDAEEKAQAPPRPLAPGQRLLAEIIRQAASIDMAPSHEAPLVKKLRRARRSTAGPRLTKPPLTVETILSWADAHRDRHGRWPSKAVGAIEGASGETWSAVDLALNRGWRGLPGGSSLAQLLADRRGHRNRSALPPYSLKEILVWMDAYHLCHGEWPAHDSGPIEEAPGETWCAVQHALYGGKRGFPGGSSLAKLLEKHRGVRNVGSPPPLTEEIILAWADEYFAAHRTWPSKSCGPIPGTVGETWATVDNALIQGGRGSLPGGDSLAKLLKRRRNKTGRRRIHRRPTLTEEEILAWADSWHQRFGRWPHCGHREPLPEAPDENWLALNAALNFGYRGLPGGESLSQFLRCCGRR